MGFRLLRPHVSAVDDPGTISLTSAGALLDGSLFEVNGPPTALVLDVLVLPPDDPGYGQSS